MLPLNTCSTVKQVIALIVCLTVLATSTKSLSQASDTINATDNKTYELEVQMSADRSRAYSAEQVLITVTVSAPIEAFALTGKSPIAVDADISQVAQTESQITDSGRERRVIKTVFALFTKQDGPLTLKPVTYTATLPASLSTNENRGKNPLLKTVSNSLEITILPRRTEKPLWFPASSVDISSRWSNLTTNGSHVQLTAGIPVQRTLIISAAAQMPSELPVVEVKGMHPSTMRAYPKPSTIESTLTVKGVNSQRLQEFTLLPMTTGQVVLPAVSLQWWDINTKQWMQAVLAAETVTVAEHPDSNLAKHKQQADFYRLLSAVLTVVSLVLLLICILLGKRGLSQQQSLSRQHAHHKRIVSEKNVWQQLQKAIRACDGEQLKRSLVEWTALTAEDNRSTGFEVLLIQHPTIAAELSKIQANLYGPTGDDPKCVAQTSINRVAPVDFKKIDTALRQVRKTYFANKRLAKKRFWRRLSTPSTAANNSLYP